jgi:hypothetical protein
MKYMYLNGPIKFYILFFKMRNKILHYAIFIYTHIIIYFNIFIIIKNKIKLINY